MPTYYDVGDIIRTAGAFTDTGGAAADPTLVTLDYQTPDGTAASVAGTSGGLSNPSSGSFTYDITATASGAYWYRYSSTGSITTAQEGSFRVRKQHTSTA